MSTIIYRSRFPTTRGGFSFLLVMPHTLGYYRYDGFGGRRTILDIAVLNTRQFSRPPKRPPVLRMSVEAGAAGIGPQAGAEHQFCVPAVSMNGESFRLATSKKAQREGLATNAIAKTTAEGGAGAEV
jgi:hypothetical protein